MLKNTYMLVDSSTRLIVKEQSRKICDLHVHLELGVPRARETDKNLGQATYGTATGAKQQHDPQIDSYIYGPPVC